MGRSGCAPLTHPSKISKRIPMTDSTELEPTISTVFAPEPSMPTYQEEQQRIRANYERSGTSPSSPRRQNQRYARFRWTRTSAARSGCRSSIRPVASGSSIRERSRDARSCCRMQIAPTRSLADFAKLVELFDAHGVSFVSVTQQFNTTTSMGRLTLNVLLSFAQFEREVTSERIRDKIAASKRKGLWVGGPLPLGYDMKD